MISKPVGRPIFVLGKYLGVAAALVLSSLYMMFVFLLVEQHTVLQTVRDPIHVPVIVFGLSAVVLGLGAAIWCNYFYGKVFASTAICFTTPLVALAYLFSLLFDHDFTPQPIGRDFEPDLWLALASLMMAILVLTALAIAASARLGQLMTLLTTLGAFFLGLLSDWIFGRPINALHALWLERAKDDPNVVVTEVPVKRVFELAGTGEVVESVEMVEQASVPLTQMATFAEEIKHAFLWICYAIVPNFQLLWLADALTQGHKIPPSHVAVTGVYALMYIGIALSLAVILFQRREVG